MNVREFEHKYRKKIDIPFEDNEYSEYRSFLKETGRKAGPWVHRLILDAMASEKAIRSNKTQIDTAAFEPQVEAKS